MSETTNEVTAEATDEVQQDAVSEERTYTKDDIERIVKTRLARFEDYDALKAERDELVKAKEESASSIESVNTTFSEFKAKATKRIVEAEAKALAASLGFHYPDDAALYVDASTAVDEDGNVSTDLISAQLSKIAEERPALIRSNSKASGTDVGLGTTGTPKKKSTGQLFADALGQF